MNETKMTVGLIFGGPSGEHEISWLLQLQKILIERNMML